MTTRDSKSSSEHLAVGSRGTGLRELSAKWRDRSTVHLRARHIDEHSAMAAADRGLGFAYGHCADELDAALSALPLEEGLRAWVQHKGSCGVFFCHACRHSKFNHDAIGDRRGPCDYIATCACCSFLPGECSCGLDAALARLREPLTVQAGAHPFTPNAEGVCGGCGGVGADSHWGHAARLRERIAPQTEEDR